MEVLDRAHVISASCICVIQHPYRRTFVSSIRVANPVTDHVDASRLAGTKRLNLPNVACRPTTLSAHGAAHGGSKSCYQRTYGACHPVLEPLCSSLSTRPVDGAIQ